MKVRKGKQTCSDNDSVICKVVISVCLIVCMSGSYRVSHETWQLVDSFECLLSYQVLYIKGCLQFMLLKIFYSKMFCFEINFIIIILPSDVFLLFSFVLKNLTNYGRRHLKLFTNCHVSWDTLYLKLHRFKASSPLVFGLYWLTYTSFVARHVESKIQHYLACF